jgi:hypothetical protein
MAALVATGVRVCEQCHTPFTRRGTAETPSRFNKRRFCERACATKALRPTRPALEPPPVKPTVLREIAGVWRPGSYGWPDQPGGRP